MRQRRPSTTTVSDEELLLVAEVARRESWADLTRPPEMADGRPRSLAEAQAVAHFARAAERAGARPKGRPGLRARLLVAAACLAGLGACWYVSPTRTAVALLGAGVFCLFALRRRGRSPRRRPKHPLLGR